MKYFEAIATINGIYNQEFKGQVLDMSVLGNTCRTIEDSIESNIFKQAQKMGDVFTVSIIECVTANTPQELEEKTAGAV